MALDDTVPGRFARWLPVAEPDWDAVYAEQLPRVYNYFRYRFGPIPEVEDLTGRTFEKAWAARARYRRDVAGFSTWLLSIARNVAIDYTRSRRSFLPLDSADLPVSASSPEDAAARRSDAQRLSALLGTLADRDRELIAMKYGAGMNNRAIARATGLTESNVGTILHRVVGALRDAWQPRAAVPSRLETPHGR